MSREQRKINVFLVWYSQVLLVVLRRFARGTVTVRSRFVRGTSYWIQQQDSGRTFNLPRPHAFASVFPLASTVSECVQFKESSTERAATARRLVFIIPTKDSLWVLSKFARGTVEVRTYGTPFVTKIVAFRHRVENSRRRVERFSRRRVKRFISMQGGELSRLWCWSPQ